MQSKADYAYDCHPAGVSESNPSDLDRAAAGSHGLVLCRCEPVAHKVKQFGREPRKERRIGAATPSCIGEHFERAAFSTTHRVAPQPNGMMYGAD
jgi:hypothetical protein